MNFVEKNEESIHALAFALTGREKTTILIGIYDTDTTREQAIGHIAKQLEGSRQIIFDLFGQHVNSLLAFLRENLPDNPNDNLPVVHLTRLDPLLFTTYNHKVVSSDLVAQINMEREMLFHELKALVVMWLTREGYNRLRMDAPDFMDWVVAAFVFEGDTATSTPLSFHLPKETVEDKNKAALLQLRAKADNLRQRTVKFEQRAKLSTRDAKEYFNLLLALIAVLRDLHDLEQTQSTLERAYNLAKDHHLAYGFEMGTLLFNWGDTEVALGNLDKAMTLFEEAIHHFSLLKDYANMAIVYAKLGEISLKQKDKSKAKAHFQQAETLWAELVRDAPGQAEAQRFLGRVRELLSDLD